MVSRKSKERNQARINKVLEQRKQRVPTSSTVAVQTEEPKERKPRPAPDERIEDLAVFARTSREQLTTELQSEAERIAKSLELVYEGNFDAAADGLKEIARSSPYSDWRLFIRGLIGFYNHDSVTATQNWSRLDRQRRPSRIASVLLHSEMSEHIGEEFPVPTKYRLAEAQALRVRPELVNAAKRIATIVHRVKDTTFSVSQVAMLTKLRDDFRSIDSEFVKTFSYACVRLAYFQPNASVFQMLIKQTPGPIHDPNWNLLDFRYSKLFDGGEAEAAKAAAAYLKSDLPSMNHLKVDLKNAIESFMQLELAQLELDAGSSSMFPFRFAADKPDYLKVERLIATAIKKCPTNRDAHEMRLSTLQKQLESIGLSKVKEIAIERKMVIAKEGLVQAFPNDVETALWLIDHYFEEDRLDRAESLIKNLGEQRLNDPLAKALPWKLKIREAMWLSHRKNSLVLVSDALAEAEVHWPTWLNQNWLPFLSAAFQLRMGNQGQFQELDKAAREKCGASQTVGDVMMFAALQQMGIPSGELKPFRDVVDGLVKASEKLSLTDLTAIGSFFWDLLRAGIKHKGYRIQASRFGKAFCSQMKQQKPPSNDQRFIDACCWAANHRFWPTGNSVSVPAWLQPLSLTEPKVAAAILRCQMNERHLRYRIIDSKPEIALIQQAARNEKDLFYRFLFDKTVAEANAQIAAFEADQENRRASRSFSFFDDDLDDDEFEDDDDDWSDEDVVDEIDDVCQCASCQARRARAKSSAAKADRRTNSDKESDVSQRSLFDDDDDDEDEEDIERNDVAVPPIAIKIFSRLGPAGAQELMELSDKSLSEDDSAESELAWLERLRSFLLSKGISDRDTAKFIEATIKTSVSSPSMAIDDDPKPPPIVLTPEEKKAQRKQREKELANRKKQRAKKENRS